MGLAAEESIEGELRESQTQKCLLRGDDIIPVCHVLGYHESNM